MVVDDNAAILEIVSELISAAGYQPITATGGKECLARLPVEKPDLVLLDINMPDMDGWTVLRTIKEKGLAGDTKVMMLTATTEIGTDIFGLQDVVSGYIRKPFNNEELRATIEGVPPEDQLRAFIKRCRDRGVRWNVGIAEWNWWLQASHWDGRAFEEPPTALHGLYIAGMIRRFATLAPDFEVACFYNLVNCMGILNHRGADVEVTDAVRIFKLYRSALPGHFVPVDLEGGAAGDDAAVEALALENDDGRWLFLANRSATEAARVSLEGVVSTEAKVEGFVAASPMGTFAKAKIKPKDGMIDLPPLSIPDLTELDGDWQEWLEEWQEEWGDGARGPIGPMGPGLLEKFGGLGECLAEPAG